MEKAFIKYLHRSPASELRRIRLDNAERMLTETNESVEDDARHWLDRQWANVLRLRDEGAAILLVPVELEEVLALADRILAATGLDGAYPEVFMAMASCADAKVSLLGLPYEAYSGALFLAIAAAMAWVVGTRRR